MAHVCVFVCVHVYVCVCVCVCVCVFACGWVGVGTCNSLLQSVAVCCSMLQHVAATLIWGENDEQAP